MLNSDEVHGFCWRRHMQAIVEPKRAEESAPAEYPKDWLGRLYYQMVLIRKFEERLAELYKEGVLRGSLHLCIGQEATGVGGCAALRREDYVTCTYRGHGQSLAKGLSPRAAM